MRVGSYEVTGVLGKGGVGAVHRARAADGTEVAIKVLQRLTPDALARFDRERRLLADVSAGGGFVPVLDAGESEQGPYLVMPLLTGGTLSERLQRGPLPIEEVVGLATTLATSLAKAHARGLVHRDLKPDNVIFDDTGTPLIADLGLAKHFRRDDAGGRSPSLSKTGVARGTFGYMAPEQFSDAKSVGPASDVYSLAVLLWECFAGRKPFEGDELFEVLRAQLDGRVDPIASVRPGVPAAVARAIDQALTPSPADRPSDAGAFLAALGGARRFPRRLVAVLLALSALASVAVGAVGAWVARSDRVRPEPRTTDVGQVTSSNEEPPPPPSPPPPAPSPRHFPARCGTFLETPRTRLEAFHGTRGLVHLRNVGAVAFAPGGRLAASASNDSTVRVWDVERARAVYTFFAAMPVLGVTFLSDDRLVSTDLAGTLRLWDLRSGADVGHSTAVGMPLRGLSASADGLRLLTGGDDGKPRLWDVSSLSVVRLLPGHSTIIHATSLAPDGLRAVSCSEDGTVKVWELSEGAELSQLVGHSGRVGCVAFATDGRAVLSGGEDRTVRAWDSWSGTEAYRLEGHTGSVEAIAISRGGTTAVSGGDDRLLHVWDLTERRLVSALPGHHGQIQAVAISPDGRRALSGGGDEEVHLWDLVAGRDVPLEDAAPEPAPYVGHRAPVRALAVSRDGRRALTAGFDAKVRSWSTEDGGLELLRTFDEHTNLVTSAAITSDGRVGLTGSFDTTARVWDLASGSSVALVGHPAAVNAVGFLADGRVVTAGFDATLRIWNPTSGECLSVIDGADGPILALAVVPGSPRVVVGTARGEIRLLDVDAGKALGSLHPVDAVVDLAVSADGRFGYVASKSGRVLTLELETGKLSQLPVPTANVALLGLFADGPLVCATSTDRVLRMVDPKSGLLRDQLDLGSTHAGVTGLGVAPDGTFFLVGNERGEVLRFALR